MMCGIDWLDFIQYVIVKKYSSTFWKPALTTPRASRSVCGLCAFSEVQVSLMGSSLSLHPSLLDECLP